MLALCIFGFALVLVSDCFSLCLPLAANDDRFQPISPTRVIWGEISLTDLIVVEIRVLLHDLWVPFLTIDDECIWWTRHFVLR